MALLPQMTFNGIKVTSCRLSFLWRGCWIADLELDVEDVKLAAPILAAKTPGLLLAGGSTLKCVIDPNASGVFADKAHARVVGGNGGWDKVVAAQHFQNPGAALVSTLVYAATAAAVLEPPPLDPIPQIFGEHYARVKGPASRVFGSRDWFVHPLTGIVSVTAWPPAIPDPEWTIIDFDISQKRITISGENIILPGTVIADVRFGTKTYIARDVEQVFDSHGSTATVWVSENESSRLSGTLESLIQEMSGSAALKTYKYRFVIPVGGKMALQGITPGAPDLNPIEQWTGISGIAAKLAGQTALAPATEIIVGFAGGDLAVPYIAAFSDLSKPLGLSLDAVTFVNVGTPLGPVALAAGVSAQVAALQIEIAAIVAALAAQAGAGAWSAATAVSTMAPALAAAVTAATLALATGAPLVPSKKLNSE